LVCFELAPTNRIISCSAPTTHQQHQQEASFDDNHGSATDAEDKPSTSQSQQQEEDMPDLQPQPNLKTDTEKG
jgi:hypothetical protein